MPSSTASSSLAASVTRGASARRASAFGRAPTLEREDDEDDARGARARPVRRLRRASPARAEFEVDRTTISCPRARRRRT